MVESEDSNTKFNSGDVAEIVANVHGHSFDIGTKVRLKVEAYFYIATSVEDESESWWVMDSELKEV